MVAVASARASLLVQTTGASRAEARLRRAVRQRGAVGYRKAYRLTPVGLPRRSADMAWPGRRIAVFFDGCFWHSCPLHRDARYGANAGYWVAKLARNAERDRETRAALMAAGWTVLEVWEHDDALAAADMIARVVLGAAGRAV